MAYSIFNLDGQAFSVSTHGVILPCHILMLQLPEEEDHAVVNPGAPQEEREQGTPHTENSLLNAVMAHAIDLKTFQEFESYFFYVDSGSDIDVPEDSDDEIMDEISIEGEPSPVTLL